MERERDNETQREPAKSARGADKRSEGVQGKKEGLKSRQGVQRHTGLDKDSL